MVPRPVYQLYQFRHHGITSTVHNRDGFTINSTKYIISEFENLRILNKDFDLKTNTWKLLGKQKKMVWCCYTEYRQLSLEPETEIRTSVASGEVTTLSLVSSLSSRDLMVSLPQMLIGHPKNTKTSVSSDSLVSHNNNNNDTTMTTTDMRTAMVRNDSVEYVDLGIEPPPPYVFPSLLPTPTTIGYGRTRSYGMCVEELEGSVPHVIGGFICFI